jgi:hypothetical protein
LDLSPIEQIKKSSDAEEKLNNIIEALSLLAERVNQQTKNRYFRNIGRYITKLYIPQAIREALKLDPERDKSLILVHDHETGLNLLVKDSDLVETLKPLILDSRQISQKLKNTYTLTSE